MTNPVADEEGFTELVDPEVPRVDLVGKPANGSSRWLLMKQAARGGLMHPDAIRDLIGKSETIPPEETVTMTGSPAAIAKMIHEAATRSRQDGPAPAADVDEQVAKAEMDTADINDLPDSDFAYIEPGGKKDEHGRTTPRSLRHFPIHDAAHVRNALSRAPQSPFGDKAMPKIRSAAKKFGIEVAKMTAELDGMDPAVIMAEPAESAPGNPTTPGSPAWEAIDAATARKWTGILARAKAAIDVLADREMMEAASGANPDDADQAFDLQDACCAIDYAISVLAPFAVAEQAEADCGEEMAAVGKALTDFDPAPLEAIEALGAVAKAGRVLSTANEAAIRGAVEQLQKVLASLPAAPVAKTAHEEPNMPEPTPSEDVTAASGQEPAMGTRQPEPKQPAGLPIAKELPVAAGTTVSQGLADGIATPAPAAGPPVVKADGDKAEPVAVYDAKGKLVGIVDPEKITRIAGAEPDGDEPPAPEPAPAPAGEPGADMTPAPAATVGTPADAVPDDGVTKTTTPANNPDSTTTSSDADSSITAMAKRLETYSATQEQVISQQAATIAKQEKTLTQLADTVETLKGQVLRLEEQPAEPKVFTNGAVPPAHQLRGQDRGAGATQIDVAKATEMKKGLYGAADASEQNRIAEEMQTSAIAALQAIHQRRAQ